MCSCACVFGLDREVTEDKSGWETVALNLASRCMI